MKYKVASIVLVLAMLLAGFTSSVEAGAYTTQFTTSVTYQNVGDGPATIQLVFFPESNANGIPISLPELAPLAGTSIYVGGVGDIANGFKGSAVMSSDQPLVSTLVQIGKEGSGVAVRPMSNGFSGGSDYVLVPTALKGQFDTNSIISVQNVSFDPADYELVFVPVEGENIVVERKNVPPHATLYFDLGVMSEIPASFNGSLRVFSTQEVVASSMELNIDGVGAYAFEGATEFSDTIYMPSALCKYNDQNSSYAVQNTTDDDIDVTVKFSSGEEVGPITLAAGAKRSFNACEVNDDGYIGSAIIEATGEIVAMGKVYGGGLSTAFLGFSEGSSKIALPYVRWTTDNWYDGTRQRAYIAIQNVSDIDLAEGDVVVKYYDKNGVLVGTDTLGAIPAGGKANSNAGNIGEAGAEFGVYPDGSYGGAAVVEGPDGAQLAVIVRIAQMTGSTMVAEDYNGIYID